MNISLPPALREWVEQQVRQNGFGTASEYIRQLLREEQQRRRRLEVEERLAEAAASGPPAQVTETTWKESQQRVAARLKGRSRKHRAHDQDR